MVKHIKDIKVVIATSNHVVVDLIELNPNMNSLSGFL